MITFQNLTSGINPEKTVGVFRKFNLDFCCGGGISLKKACSDNDVDLNEFSRNLKNCRFIQALVLKIILPGRLNI